MNTRSNLNCGRHGAAAPGAVTSVTSIACRSTRRTSAKGSGSAAARHEATQVVPAGAQHSHPPSLVLPRQHTPSAAANAAPTIIASMVLRAGVSSC